jgi:hypothetical protein
MPYIPQQQRIDIHNDLLDDELGGLNWTPENAGELNFLVSTFIANYIKTKGLKYAVVNEMIGALECAKLELNRVIIGPYEDIKIQENGPVYDGILPSGEY